MEFKLFNLVTYKESKKTWKTYEGAAKNAQAFDIISTPEGIEWMQKHPEWAKERVNNVPSFMDVVNISICNHGQEEKEVQEAVEKNG